MMSFKSASQPEVDDTSEMFGSTCKSCGVTLEVPWVRCVKCQPHQDICARCFSFGVEYGLHENDHPYVVVKYNFPLFEASWTAAEEVRLLDAIQECGLGNWQAVSARMRTKSPEDCERHYMWCYVENPQPPLPEFADPECIDKGAPIIFKLSDNPPRPAEGSTLWTEMGGYSSARCEFSVEYDNFIEMDICHMTFDDDEDDSSDDEKGEDNEMDDKDGENRQLYRDVKLAALDAYRNCLRERQRRKCIIRDYGLINLRKWYGIFKRRYNHSFSLDFLRPFMRLFPPVTFDKYLESLLYEKQLKSDISRLQEYRRNGITRLRSVKAFYMMRQRRDNARAQRHLLHDVLNHVKDEYSCQTWLARQAGIEGSSKSPVPALPNLPRKVAPRLRIDGLPSYEKLTESEKELCSEVRLVPEAFLEFSKILTSECSKQGFLRLAQARTLIKIDVNKTRKLYDFLVQQGQINKDPLPY